MNDENPVIDDNLVIKATFLDCSRSQDRLRKKLQKLIAENRCLNDSERDVFFQELAQATYGLGITKPFVIYIKVDDIPGQIYTMGNIEGVARWLAMQTSNQICVPSDMGKACSPMVDISVFWDTLLQGLFYVFPAALDRSSAMSKERDATTGGMGYEFDPFS